MTKLTLKQNAELEIFENERQAERGRGKWENFKEGEILDVDILDNKEDSIDFQFGDGSISVGIPKSLFDIQLEEQKNMTKQQRFKQIIQEEDSKVRALFLNETGDEYRNYNDALETLHNEINEAIQKALEASVDIEEIRDLVTQIVENLHP